MSELIRFGVSMDGRLLARFGQLIDEKGYFKKVRGIKDLIRDEVVEHFLSSLSCSNFFHF